MPSTKRGFKGTYETRVEQACRNCTNIKNRQNKARDASLKIIEQIIEEEDLTRMINMIEEQVNEADYTAMDIAAAFLKMYLGQNEAPEEEDTKDGGFDFDNTGAEEEGMARLFINIGKAQKVKAKDILGAIAGEANIPGKLVGAIDLYDKYTFVEVPKEHARAVMKAMKNVKIKGKAINIEPANAR